MFKAILALVFVSSVLAVTYPGDDSTCAFVHGPLVTADPPVLQVLASGISIQAGETVLTLTVRASKRFFQADMSLSGETNATLCGSKFVAVADPTDPLCHYLITAVIAWADHDTCGVVLDASSSTSALDFFRGSILLTEHEHLSSIRNVTVDRELGRVLPFGIRFPKTVSASHDITVFANPWLLAAVIRQVDVRSAAATSAARGDVVIYTNLQFPFKLSTAYFTYASRSDFTTNPPVQSAGPLLTGGTCNDVSGQACEQEWAFFVNATSPPICEFTGDWNITFEVVCEPSAAASCPLPSGEVTAITVPFHLTTENFCPTVFADVRLSASLESFQDAAHAVTKDNFLSGATAYFVATVSSPDAQIVETTLHTVSSGATMLYNLPAFSATGFSHTDFPRVAGVSSHPTQSWFDQVLDATTFPVAVDSSAPFNFAVVLDVVFANTEPAGLSRRFMVLLAPRVLVADGAAGTADAHTQVALSTLSSGASAVSVSAVLIAVLAVVQWAL